MYFFLFPLQICEEKQEEEEEEEEEAMQWASASYS